jgi:hypothetical protein
MLFASDTPTHTQKNGALRVLLPIKRANSAAFCLYDRAAGRRSPLAMRNAIGTKLEELHRRTC